MLLLVVSAEFHQAHYVRRHGIGKQPEDVFIDVPAVILHLLQRGTRKTATQRTMRMGCGARLSELLVIGIEQKAKSGIEWLVVRQVRLKDERFEKPCRVSLMPFCRAGFRHGLDHLVLG